MLKEPVTAGMRHVLLRCQAEQGVKLALCLNCVTLGQLFAFSDLPSPLALQSQADMVTIEPDVSTVRKLRQEGFPWVLGQPG